MKKSKAEDNLGRAREPGSRGENPSTESLWSWRRCFNQADFGREVPTQGREAEI